MSLFMAVHASQLQSYLAAFLLLFFLPMLLFLATTSDAPFFSLITTIKYTWIIIPLYFCAKAVFTAQRENQACNARSACTVLQKQYIADATQELLDLYANTPSDSKEGNEVHEHILKASALFRPYFFPLETTHTRVSPVKHKFSYNFTWAGIPLSEPLNCNGILAIFEKMADNKPVSSWFTVDADDYLIPGTIGSIFEEKMTAFLEYRNIKEDYPNHYLLTGAKVAGYASNPASLFYLYDDKMKLQIIIVQVNNTFGQRHLYVLRRKKEGPEMRTRAGAKEPDSGDGEFYEDEHAGRPVFKCTWTKDFFVSPFNSQHGSYSLITSDPINPGYGETVPRVQITLSQLNKRGQVEVVARIKHQFGKEAIAIEDMTWLQGRAFVLKTVWGSFATIPRTAYQALKLRFRHGLPFRRVPPPAETTFTVTPTPRSAIPPSRYRGVEWARGDAVGW